MTISKDAIFAGRKFLKSIEAKARSEALPLLEGRLLAGTNELDDAKAMMMPFHSLKPKNIDAVIIQPPMLRVMGSWQVVLVLADMPRGVPNMLGAPIAPKSKEEAEAIAYRMVRAAYMKCEETRRMMRAGNMEDQRIFDLGTLRLGVPGGMVDAAAKQYPVIPPELQANKLRAPHIDKLTQLSGPGGMNEKRWENLSEDEQIQVMVACSHLLCLNINKAA